MTTQLTANASAIYQGFSSRTWPVVAYQCPALALSDIAFEMAEVSRRLEKMPSLDQVSGLFRVDLVEGVQHVHVSDVSGAAFLGLKKLESLIEGAEAQIKDASTEDKLRLNGYIERLKASKDLVTIPQAPNGRFAANPVKQPLQWLMDEAPAGTYLLTGWEALVSGDKRSFEVTQMLASMARNFGCSRKSVVIVSNGSLEIPEELKMMPSVFKHEMPGAEAIEAYIRPVIEVAPSRASAAGVELAIELSDEDYKAMSQSAQGLTLAEVYRITTQHIFGRLSLRSEGYETIDSGLTQKLIEFKTSKLADMGVHFAPAPDVVPAGMDNWQQWVDKRKQLFWNRRETTLKVPSPKGALLVGPPGTGKTLAAKSLASQWNIPLLTLDLSSLYSSLVGSSEQRLRGILELIGKCAPCAVLIDEIDKGAAGATDGGGDAGTSKRLFSMLLQWLNDKPANIFVIATANNPLGIYRTMPEMFRKGRFDEIFLVDLPTVSGRMAILKTHLATQGVELSDADMRDVAETADMFTGSELAAIVDEAAIEAYCNGEDSITMGALKNAAMSANPIATMEGTNIQAIREWASRNAKPSSSPEPVKKGRRKSAAAETLNASDNMMI